MTSIHALGALGIFLIKWLMESLVLFSIVGIVHFV